MCLRWTEDQTLLIKLSFVKYAQFRGTPGAFMADGIYGLSALPAGRNTPFGQSEIRAKSSVEKDGQTYFPIAPNTFFSRLDPLPIGSWRIAFSRSAIIRKRPSIAFCVT